MPTVHESISRLKRTAKDEGLHIPVTYGKPVSNRRASSKALSSIELVVGTAENFAPAKHADQFLVATLWHVQLNHKISIELSVV